jgi:SAM-dependent methyltransferase
MHGGRALSNGSNRRAARTAGKDTLAHVSYPERIVPDETESGIVALHLKRYAFAEPWCRSKDVLDVACGVGYGSAFLGETAGRVVGVDLSEDAIEYARERYRGANLEFVVADATALPFDADAFDVVCSFETIEHLPDRDAYLAEVSRVLRPAGTYLVSTPSSPRTTDRPENPFHHVEYERSDFETLLRRFFDSVDMYGQRRLQTLRHRLLQRADIFGLRRRLGFLRGASRLVGTPPMAGVTLDDVVIEREQLDRAQELVAVCTAPRA